MIDTNRLDSFAGVIDHAIRKGEGQLPVTHHDADLAREAAAEIKALRVRLLAYATSVEMYTTWATDADPANGTRLGSFFHTTNWQKSQETIAEIEAVIKEQGQ